MLLPGASRAAPVGVAQPALVGDVVRRACEHLLCGHTEILHKLDQIAFPFSPDSLDCFLLKWP